MKDPVSRNNAEFQAKITGVSPSGSVAGGMQAQHGTHLTPFSMCMGPTIMRHYQIYKVIMGQELTHLSFDDMVTIFDFQ